MQAIATDSLPPKSTSIQPVSLSVEGMTCASCVGRLERALMKVPGVQQVHVNLATERADILPQEGTAALNVNALVAAVEAAGYSVPSSQVMLQVEGMSCASCVARVERALLAVPGVRTAQVNLATEKAMVQGQANADALLNGLRQAGYDAQVIAPDESAQSNDSLQTRRAAEQDALRRDFFIAAAFALPVFVLEMGAHMFPPMHHWLMAHVGQSLNWLIQFVLTTVVLLFPGRRFYAKGLPALWRLAPDMNSLVAVGTLSAYGYSVIATFLPGLLPQEAVHVYYEAAAVIVALILLGRLLEARAKGRTSEAIARLVGLKVKRARVLRNGQILDIPVSSVSPSDRIQINPGDRIPVDGIVIEGHSWVDEAMISGEPVPVEKSPGISVTGGTVNQQGALLIEATAVGEHTVLAQIIRLVEQAQSSKLPIQTVVDRITLWFVPAIMLIAALTGVTWWMLGPAPSLSFALANAVAVLIIACPCAMGLATPTSIMVGTGRGADLGILFRKGEALQSLRDVQVIAFDKTGTLTEGKPQLTHLETAPGLNRQHVLALVAAVESRSEHPIAEALVQAAQREAVTIPELQTFEAIAGMGVRATVSQNGKPILVEVGADRFMQSLGLNVSSFAGTAAQLAQAGQTPLYAAINGQLAAIIAVADAIKASTPAAIAALHSLGLKVAMITGDNTRTAHAIAAQLGIDDVVAEVMPEGKVRAIERLRESHGHIAFVGDGINDAPALAAADAGLAIGTGTDVAMEAADVVLMSGNLQGVPRAIALSRATLRNIHQNLFWAFAYNMALIPLAAGILYPRFGILLSPAFAAGAMAASSVFVLGNALRLRGVTLSDATQEGK